MKLVSFVEKLTHEQIIQSGFYHAHTMVSQTKNLCSSDFFKFVVIYLAFVHSLDGYWNINSAWLTILRVLHSMSNQEYMEVSYLVAL